MLWLYWRRNKNKYIGWLAGFKIRPAPASYILPRTRPTALPYASVGASEISGKNTIKPPRNSHVNTYKCRSNIQLYKKSPEPNQMTVLLTICMVIYSSEYILNMCQQKNFLRMQLPEKSPKIIQSTAARARKIAEFT